MQPLVSIIIPTYNRSHLIGETLDSVLVQTYKNWECIVVDDVSEDYTDQLLNLYEESDVRIKYHHRPESLPKGANACRNYGFDLSKGEFIQWLDSDDLFVPEAIEKKVFYLNNNYHNISICNTRDLHSSLKYFSKPVKQFSSNSKLLIHYFTGKISLNTPSILWKRSLVANFQYDEKLFRAQELDFNLRVLQDSKVNPVFIDEVLILIRSHHKSMTGAYNQGDLSSIMSELRIRRKTLSYVFEHGGSSKDKVLSLNIYLRGIRKLYKNQSIISVMKEFGRIENDLGLKETYIKWKFKFIYFLLIYKVTRHEFQLKNHLYQLKNYIRL